jgi:hypothetical protein
LAGSDHLFFALQLEREIFLFQSIFIFLRSICSAERYVFVPAYVIKLQPKMEYFQMELEKEKKRKKAAEYY